MAAISLQCKDKRFSKGVWVLELDEGGASLTDSEGITRAVFLHAEAQGRFVLPSFWESIKDLGVRSDSGDTIWFVPDGATIAQIQTYLHGALAAQGPEAIRALRRKGWLMVFAGGGFALVSILVMMVSMARAFGNPAGGTYYVTIGATVFGLIVLSRGVAALSKAIDAAGKLDPENGA